MCLNVRCTVHSNVSNVCIRATCVNSFANICWVFQAIDVIIKSRNSFFVAVVEAIDCGKFIFVNRILRI